MERETHEEKKKKWLLTVCTVRTTFQWAAVFVFFYLKCLRRDIKTEEFHRKLVTSKLSLSDDHITICGRLPLLHLPTHHPLLPSYAPFLFIFFLLVYNFFILLFIVILLFYLTQSHEANVATSWNTMIRNNARKRCNDMKNKKKIQGNYWKYTSHRYTWDVVKQSSSQHSSQIDENTWHLTLILSLEFNKYKYNQYDEENGPIGCHRCVKFSLWPQELHININMILLLLTECHIIVALSCWSY